MIIPRAGRMALLSRFCSGVELGLFSRIENGAIIECDAPDYIPKQIPDAEWLLDAENETATSPERMWIFLSPADRVAGFFARHVSTGEIVFADTFRDGPVQIDRPGDHVKVVAVLKFFAPES